MPKICFSAVKVDCHRKNHNPNGEPTTSVTFQMVVDGEWRTNRRWYSVSEVVVDYPGQPLHSVGDEVSDIMGQIKTRLDLYGDQDLDGDPDGEK